MGGMRKVTVCAATTAVLMATRQRSTDSRVDTRRSSTIVESTRRRLKPPRVDVQLLPMLGPEATLRFSLASSIVLDPTVNLYSRGWRGGERGGSARRGGDGGLSLFAFFFLIDHSFRFGDCRCETSRNIKYPRFGSTFAPWLSVCVSFLLSFVCLYIGHADQNPTQSSGPDAQFHCFSSMRTPRPR